MIHDVTIRELRVFSDNRGRVMHMMRADSPAFERFGEIYFSTIRSGAVKAWKRHREMTLNLAVPQGEIRLVMADHRIDSPSCGSVQTIDVGDQNYCLVTIPPGIWNGFKGISSHTAIVANCATLPHDPEEVDRLPMDTTQIDYQWR